MKSGAKRKGLLASLGLTFLAVISVAVWLVPSASDNAAEANHGVTVGIDTDTSGNSALALGTLQACRVIGFGQIIDVDLYVQGLSDIAAFESYIKYDNTKIAILKPGASNQNNNGNFMLQQAQPSPPGNAFNNTSEALPDSANPGEYRVGGYDSVVIPGVEDPDPIGHTHKDGVLVRLQIQGLPGLGGFTAIQISPHGTNNAFGINIKDSSGLINVGDGADSDVFVDNVVNGAIVVGSGTCTDADGDGVPDTNDNCPTTANANQANFDGDSQGDACDTDDDNDGLLDTSEPSSGCIPSGGGRLDPDCDNDNISDGSLNPDGAGPILPGPDNCVTTPNTDQLNTDGDSMGNVCDTDDDNDTVLDGVDNCPINANASQTNSDSDAQGDACDLEDDGDGYLDTTETHVGTNSIDNCGAHTSTAPVFSQAWPGDVYSGTGIPATANKVTVQDLTSYLAPVRRINTNVGDLPLNVRWDLTPGKGLFAKDVNIQDLTSLVTVTPDMFGGARAFNGPTCTP